MRVEGYMVTADLTDQALVIDAKNKASRIALFGKDGVDDGPLAIPVGSIASVELKRANALVNGNLIVRVADGRKYQLHFRKKSQDEFANLAAALRR